MIATTTEKNAGVEVGVSGGNGKLMHLQILRAMAAALVVVDHAFSFVDYNVHHGGEYVHAGERAGHAGVTAFFVLSGFIMVRQSGKSFGTSWGTVVFWWRRLIRIVPMYWLAVCWAFLTAWREHWQEAHLGQQFLLQMAFIPDFVSRRMRLAPMMEHGWTLNYEMAFYLLFGLCLLFRRRVGIAVLLFTLYGLVGLRSASVYIVGAASPGALIAGVYTDPMILLFGYGALIGFILSELKPEVRVRLPISPALALLVPAALFLVSPSYWGEKNIWELLSGYSILLVLLCATTANNRMGRFDRWLVLLGDASYCTYLFHLHIFAFLHDIDWWGLQMHPLLFMAVSVVLANAFGVVVHRFVEVPLTRLLRKIRFGSAEARQMEALPDVGSVAV